jgi:hypothetical protein
VGGQWAAAPQQMLQDLDSSVQSLLQGVKLYFDGEEVQHHDIYRNGTVAYYRAGRLLRSVLVKEGLYNEWGLKYGRNFDFFGDGLDTLWWCFLSVAIEHATKFRRDIPVRYGTWQRISDFIEDDVDDGAAEEFCEAIVDALNEVVALRAWLESEEHHGLMTVKEIATRLKELGQQTTDKTLNNRYRKEWGEADGKRERADTFCWQRILPTLEQQFGRRLS